MIHELPTEVQEYIATFLAPSDIHSLLLCARKTYTSFLPSLYHHIDLTASRSELRRWVSPPYKRLSKLTAELQRLPERFSWVYSASFVWTNSLSSHDEVTELRTLLLQLLRNLHSIRTLVMRQNLELYLCPFPPQEDFRTDPVFMTPDVLVRLASSPNLQDLAVENPGLVVSDLYKVVALPALRRLTIYKLGEVHNWSLSSGLGISRQSPDHAPISNIQHLTFIKAQPPTDIEGYANFFALQRKLISFHWEIFIDTEFIPVANIVACMFPLRDTLTQLHLDRHWDLAWSSDIPPNDSEEKINLVEFSALKILKIHGHFVFKGPPEEQIGKDFCAYLLPLDPNLSDRLPMPLEDLQITFEYNHHTSTSLPWSEDHHYEWLISLARQSSKKASKLRKVKLVEREYPYVVTDEWAPTENLLTTFEEAGVGIERIVDRYCGKVMPDLEEILY